MKIRTYSELIKLPTFEERFEYLKLSGAVGKETFGYDRYLNQVLYKSAEWKETRNKVIIRDLGCDLACEDRQIFGQALIHHMNPITKEMILDRDRDIFNPEYLITTTKITHNAIHYGDENLLCHGPVVRTPNDTCPWR